MKITTEQAAEAVRMIFCFADAATEGEERGRANALLLGDTAVGEIVDLRNRIAANTAAKDGYSGAKT